METATQYDVDLHWNNLNAFFAHAFDVTKGIAGADRSAKSIYLIAVIAAARAYHDKLKANDDPDFRLVGLTVTKQWAEHRRSKAA